MILDPVAVLEEWKLALLALIEDRISILLHLDELLLLLVVHNLRYKRHGEKFVISIFTATFLTL